MNDLAIGKENLQKALLQVCQNYLDNLDLAPQEAVSYSPQLERKMARLLKFRRKPYWKLINTPLKKAVAACLAILIFAGGMISCKPIREPIVEFFTNVCETFTEFFFGTEDKKTATKSITEIHTLTYVPEGYELVKSPIITSNDYKLHTVWQNKSNSKIVFCQSSFSLKNILDTENSITKTLSNNIKIAVIQKSDHTLIFWNDDNYAYTIIANDLCEEEIEKIINSLN